MRIAAFAAALTLAAVSAPVAAQAATVYPVSAIGSTSFGGYPDSAAIDQGPGSELSDWSSGSQGVGAFLNLDLGAVYALDQAYVTDRVTSGGGNNQFHGGVTDFTTQFSLQFFTDATFTTTLGSAFVFNHAVPVAPSSPSDFLTVASLGGASGQFIRYTVLATNGGSNNGLSDIHFTTAAVGVVPEPATWALMIMGFGTAGAMLRRSRPTPVRVKVRK